ncbi:hypothetical protein PIIN_04659 [Serendipita indica DSM 11827]|uniref:Uncharacterized protein n=1 Tax=Serendipita indica (strain DSM 11827) TaxID=1109443 RepID=G4THD6_SERID|nr:hypothetical protein PIIN_04659 [Serendipita indica DSM 11827]
MQRTSPTQTVCYQVVESGGASSTVSAQPTIVNGLVPAGYSCYQVYSQGGGTMWSPLAQAAPNSPNKAITIALPIVVSLVGLLALVGAFFTYKRYRARRAAAADKHAWVNRPGGWAKDGANAETASTAKY